MSACSLEIKSWQVPGVCVSGYLQSQRPPVAALHYLNWWIPCVCRVYRLHERLVNLRSEYNLRLKSGVTTTQIPMMQVQTAQVQVLQQAPGRLRPELDEVTMRYIQDLLGWVEENQRRVEEAEWGSDLPTVESQLGSHRGLHQSVEEFRSKIERAKADEVPASPHRPHATSSYL